MKATKCKIRLHGASREILTGEFNSIREAKEWVSKCWDRPYTIVKIKK
jgi:rRNA processing protein Krr1/Pno1